jgi:hypothetical protein
MSRAGRFKTVLTRVARTKASGTNKLRRGLVSYIGAGSGTGGTTSGVEPGSGPGLTGGTTSGAEPGRGSGSGSGPGLVPGMGGTGGVLELPCIALIHPMHASDHAIAKDSPSSGAATRFSQFL